MSQVGDDGSMGVFKRDFSYGGGIHSRGFSLGVRYAKVLNRGYMHKKEWNFDWVISMRHFKELTYRNTGARAFVFGKKNEISILRATYGRQHIIADFEQIRSVKINLHYSIGPNVALIKPIYYLAYNPQDNKQDEVKFNENQHFSAGQFLGAARWTKGLDELKLAPGLTTKLSLSFDWGKEDNKYKSLEVGMMLDLYRKPLPIMAFAKNQSVLFNLYAVFMFGKRW